MTMRRKSDEQLMAEIRDWLARGYTDAATERLLGVAAQRSNNPAFMQAALQLVCDALNATPKPRRRKGRPPLPKSPTIVNGVIDLDSATPMTAREKARTTKRLMTDYAIAEAVELESRRFDLMGAFLEVARMRKLKEPEVRKAYYRVTGSQKT